VPAYQVTTASTAMLDGTNDGHESIGIQNLGPNPIYVELGAAAAVAGGTQVPANGGTLSFMRKPDTAVNVICAALQQTPYDTRYVRS
jgi:hypothetical protein